MVSVVRVNKARNTVAVDVKKPALKAELLKLTELCALPVRAFPPSDRTNCYGVLRDIDPDCKEHDIKTRLHATGATNLATSQLPAQKKPGYVLGVDNATTTKIAAVTVEWRRRPLTFVSAYVAPNAPWDTHALADIRVRAKGDLIVAGDFNAHSKSWGVKQDSSRGRELQATVEALDLRNITSGNQTFIRPGIVDWDRYRTLLGEAQEGGFPFNSETLSRVLKEATREVRVPLTRPNPDLEWLNLRARRPAKVILAYRRLDARFRKHGRKLARRQWRLKCSTLDRPSGGSRAWRMSRTLAGRPIPRNPVLGMAVAMHLRPTEMIELLAVTFTEVPLVPTVGPSPGNWDKYRLPSAPPMPQPDADFTLHELQYVLHALPRHRTAPGLDGVTNQALRNVNESALSAMLALINHVWRTAGLPDAWRVATTILLLKPNKPQNQLSSYRPISLTSRLGKVMERMVLRRLVYHLEGQGLYRSVFPDSGTIGARSLEEAKAQGWSAVAVFLEVRKAFDALPHKAIISALRRFGAGSAVSNPRKIIRKVNQGSVVSPLLFALAIASLPAAARVGEEPACLISMAVYADDVALWSTAPATEGNRPSNFMPTLRIGDTPVKLAKTATYPGVTLDSRLSWGPAMREVLQKMRMLGGTTWGTSSHMMLQLYRGLILSRPLYALPFATLSANLLKNLEQAQRVALRICLGLHKEPHPLRISLHIPGLRTKKNVAVAVARQLTEDHLVTQYEGWTECTPKDQWTPLEAQQQQRLSSRQPLWVLLAAIRLALWGIRTGCTQALRWVILSDSRSALELPSRLERATSLARSIAQDAVELQQEGNDIAFQWLPSH
ncbi:hypothetical protein HPB47_006742 [Ixodes persulcatus]|uniref:Uncharacterized protein n=1 Tax=Ixodes persulcatus TaxID=34615 RepID=A0AC60P9H7_IXOPE|nr:hypothetical protein HPB47_006742 [Ixodes persulcatus]